MGAQSVFITSLTVLLLFNGLMYFVPGSGASFPTVASIILTAVGIFVPLILMSIYVGASGLDTRIQKYLLAGALIIGLCFNWTVTVAPVTINILGWEWTWSPGSIGIGIGLVSNVLLPFAISLGSPFSSILNFVSVVGFVIGLIISFITLISGLLIVVGTQGD